MSFFLLGKHPDGRLRLLSEESFPTRQDAMGELSELTASPAFDAWDADVFVVDVDSGTPVLLVRPTAPEQAATAPTESDVVESPDPALTAVMLDLGVTEELGDNPAQEHETERDEAAEHVDPSVVEPEPSAEGTHAQDIVAGSFVAESDAVDVVVDAAWASAVEETSADAGLKGALERTAAKMEADGIVAPESVGHAAAPDLPGEVVAPTAATSPEERPEPAGEEPAEQEAVSEAADDAGVHADVEPHSADEQEAAEAGAPAASDEEPGGQASGPDEVTDGDVEASAQSDSVPDAEQAGDSAPQIEAPAPDEETSDGGMWPWDISVDPDSAPPLAALGESDADGESMIRAMADSDASRTVVLGEYAIDEVKGSEPFLEAAKRAAADELAVQHAEEPESHDSAGADVGGEASEPTRVEAAEGEDAAPADEATTESDFVDLGDVTPAPPAKAYEPGDIDMDGMTCDDCVYVESCPNKDEREPATCGSFQWK